MTITRFLSATSAASATTFGLFYLMQGLVAFEEVNLKEGNTPGIIEIVYQADPLVPEKKDWTVDEEDFIPREQPDDPIPEPKGPEEKGEGYTEPPLVGPKRLGKEPIKLSIYNEGDMVPIVRVEPQYPRRAAGGNIEGWVVFEFTVTEHGNVEDAFIVEAEPAGYFERASLKAVNKFRYKPRVVDGVARAVPNIRTRFSFSLEGDE